MLIINNLTNMFYLTFSVKFSYVKFFKIYFIRMVKIGELIRASELLFSLAVRCSSPLNFSHYNILKCIYQTVKYLIQFSKLKISCLLIMVKLGAVSSVLTCHKCFR
jgi:hypothetical protein